MVTLKGAHRRQFIESFFAADVDDLSTFSGRRVVGATRLLAARCAGCGGAAALRSVGGRAAEAEPAAAAAAGGEAGGGSGGASCRSVES